MHAHVVKPSIRNRRWFRFRLRTLFGLVTVAALLMGWVAEERQQSRHERQIAKQLEKQGITLTLGGPYGSVERVHKQAPQGWWRRLARQVLGERFLAASIEESLYSRRAKSNFSNLTPLAGLKSLQTLGLTDSQVSDLTPLARLKNLQWLNLGATQVSDLTPLTRLTNLQWLGLRSTQVSDLTPLAGLKNLQELRLSSTQVSDLTPLAGLKSLRTLGLTYTQVSDLTPLSRLKNLQWLQLEGTQVSDLTPLAGLKNLQWLGLGSTPVSDEQVKSLGQALPNCQISR